MFSEADANFMHDSFCFVEPSLAVKVLEYVNTTISHVRFPVGHTPFIKLLHKTQVQTAGVNVHQSMLLFLNNSPSNLMCVLWFQAL